MGNARRGASLIGVGLLLWSAVTSVWAAPPTVAQMLGFRPKQDGVAYTTPADRELDKCKVELLKATRGSGWLLRDEKGLALRRYFDLNGDNKIDVWSYYQNGVEVYREIDSNFNDKVDQYRWLHRGGSKWGADVNEDGKIDAWRMISAEEVGQEVLLAVARKDYARLQILMLPEAELKTLELPPAEVNRIREIQKQAPARFQSTLAKLGNLSDKVRWIHLETTGPECLPADAAGPKQDVLRHANGTVLYQDGDKSDWLQLGEMIQVGAVWRLIDAPVPGPAAEPRSSGGSADGMDVDKELQPLLTELQQHDTDKMPRENAAPKELMQYYVLRAGILERVVAKAKPEAREQWVHQLADCLSLAAQNSPPADKSAMQRLVQLREQTVKTQPPGSSLPAYVVYCEMSAEYALQMNSSAPGVDAAKQQQEWLKKWAGFVQDYPKADNAPDALFQLGMVNELMNEEATAKKWYEMLVKNFPNHPQRAKVEGAVRRLNLDGNEVEVSGTNLSGGAPFDLKSLRGKVVVVYYWASWNQQCAADFAKLRTMLTSFTGKVELVCPNLDNTQAEATTFLRQNPAAGVHVFEPNGMNGKLANHYGIMVLPTLFLVDKDGKCLSRNVQMSTLEDDLKKVVK